MKIFVTVDGLAALARLDTTRLSARLRAEIERELQAAAANGGRPDRAAARAALERALRRPRASGNPRKPD